MREFGRRLLESRQSISTLADVRSLARGEVLYRQGDTSCSIYQVQAGSFKTCVSTSGGRIQVAGFHVSGEFLGLDGIGAGQHACEASALEDSKVIAVPFATLSRLCLGSADLQHLFFKIMSCEDRRCQDMTVLLRTMHAERRVAIFTLDLTQRLNAGSDSTGAVTLTMRREDIGSYLGLKLETVSRMFTRLRRSGALEVTARQIRILNVEGLKSSATRSL